MKILNCLADCVADLEIDVASVLGNYLILGLASKTNRDLDTFSWERNEKKWIFPGFQKHFGWRVEKVIQQLNDRGVKAKQKRYAELNIKKLAVEAGIGKWGKNSLVIHPKFGPWLRFVVIEIDLVISPSAAEIEPKNLHIPYPRCEGCQQKCIKACPVNNLLEPFRLTRKEKCLAYIQLENPPGVSPTPFPIRRCEKCLTACMPQPRE